MRTAFFILHVLLSPSQYSILCMCFKIKLTVKSTNLFFFSTCLYCMHRREAEILNFCKETATIRGRNILQAKSI